MLKNIKVMLPPLDEDATRQAVEDELEKALLTKTLDMSYERKEASITQSYEVRYHGSTNVTSDSTAQTALYNVSTEEAKKAQLWRVERAVSKLSRKQRELITERYLTEYGLCDKDVYYGIMGISAHTYIKVRNEAFYLLAFMLKIYVEKQPKGENENNDN